MNTCHNCHKRIDCRTCIYKDVWINRDIPKSTNTKELAGVLLLLTVVLIIITL